MGNSAPPYGGQVSQSSSPSTPSPSFLTHASSPGLWPPVQRKEHSAEGPDPLPGFRQDSTGQLAENVQTKPHQTSSLPHVSGRPKAVIFTSETGRTEAQTEKAAGDSAGIQAQAFHLAHEVQFGDL